ncbi:putative UPF0481 protein At3g02645 [Magnolia sinica]|uniref:putative UPF0481 protein At3g02645 n=1 Tax=Magnolia sinica TaxID=86752 RepID=UPI00265A71DD|nr:putative UPF0481 protein At3g02645 [Magnolia sinica]
MSSQHLQALPLNPAMDEIRWIIQIRRHLEEYQEDETNIPVCIFNVPKTLIATNPDAYIPQQIALGPYHRSRPELYEMERYKVSAAKRTQKHLKSLKFQSIIDRFMKLEPRIRSCYHRYLDFSGEALAWMMALDASFLLEFLKIFTAKDSNVLETISSRMSHLVDYTGRRSAHNTILRDIMMLENQIPLFLLRKMLDSQRPSTQEADEELSAILMELCKKLSPLKMMENFPEIQVKQRTHLLELLYHTMVPKSDELKETNESEEITIEVTIKESYGNAGHVWLLFNMIGEFMSSLKVRPVCYIKKVLMSRPVKLVLKLPWRIITQLPGYSMLKQPVEYFFSSFQDKESTKPVDLNPSNNNNNRPPSVEEITIPSVSELINVGVRFSATNGDLSTISFDSKTITFYLPTVTLDVHTEVMLRNLVAFESSIASGPLVFTRYTELMSGIIDTEEDVKMLRNKGVVQSCLKSDEEVANLWNGMSRSMKMTKVPSLDKVIEDVNKYYSSRWKVKVGKCMKKYVFGSWQCLTFLACILLLLMTALQELLRIASLQHLKGLLGIVHFTIKMGFLLVILSVLSLYLRRALEQFSTLGDAAKVITDRDTRRRIEHLLKPLNCAVDTFW